MNDTKPCPWCDGTGKSKDTGDDCCICAGFGTISISWIKAEKTYQEFLMRKEKGQILGA